MTKEKIKPITSFKHIFALLAIITFVLLLSVSINAQECQENWQCNAWQKCYSGVSERSCYDLNSCGTDLNKPAETANCKEVLPYCYDKILNQDESDADCGGICESCNLGEFCLKDADCELSSCINNICSSEAALKSTPAPSFGAFAEVIIIGLISIIIVFLIIFLIKRRSIHKTGRIIIQMPRKNRTFLNKRGISRFSKNLKEYFRPANKPFKDNKPKIQMPEKKKDLLNKSLLYNKPVKKYMLDNLKEVYHDD